MVSELSVPIFFSLFVELQFILLTKSKTLIIHSVYLWMHDKRSDDQSNSLGSFSIKNMRRNLMIRNNKWNMAQQLSLIKQSFFSFFLRRNYHSHGTWIQIFCSVFWYWRRRLFMVHVPCRTDEMSLCSGISYDRLADERNCP